MKIGLMSDTHSFLDERVFEHFKDVDEIWHAGDIGDLSLADKLDAFKPLRAVYGNIDGAEARARFPLNLSWHTEGVKIWMTHIGGYPGKYPARILQTLQIEKPDLFICGHSHILKIMADKQLNLLHINPGACGNEGFHRVKTLVRFEILKAKIQNMEIIEWGLKKTFSLFMGLILSFANLFCQNLSTTVRGQVLEKTTKLPIPSARITVKVADSRLETLTDTFGSFKIEQIPIGRREIWVSSIGFKEQAFKNLVLTSSKDLVLTVELEESLEQLQEVLIKAKEHKSQVSNSLATVSARQVTMEEARRYSGNFQDIGRMVANFAGATAANDNTNDIVVRGNAPQGVLWRLEGVDIPVPAHLAFLGTEGGFSILNFNTLAHSDFLTGAFPAEYGNRNAAVFDLKLRRGNPERYEFTGQIGIAGLEFGMEGPFWRQKAKNTEGGTSGSFLASYRSFALANLQKLGLNLLSDINGLPSFQDATIKLYQPLRHNGSISVFGIGGLSQFVRKNAQQDQRTGSNMGAVGMTYNHYFSKKTRGTLWLALTGTETNRLNNDANNLGVFRLTQDMAMRQVQAQAKYELSYRPSARNLFKTGVSVLPNNFNFQYKRLVNNVLQPQFSDSGTAFLYQAYLHWQRRFTEKWTMNAGLYAQYFAFNKTQSLEPRLSVLYILSHRHRLSAAFGLHSQTQPLMFYTRQYFYAQNPQPIQTNRHLDFTQSQHYVISHDWFIHEDWRLKAELYRQQLDKVPVRRGNPVYSALNVGSVDFSILDIPDSLVNKGKGYNQGIELTLEKYFTQNYYCMTTLSVYVSKFKTLENIWRNTAFGHGYVWNLLGGYEWTFGKAKRNAISVDGKLSFLGGKPYIPIDLAASAKANRSIWQLANAYTQRLPAYNRADLKIAWRLNRAKATHFLYIELNNLFNAESYLEAFYNPVSKKEAFATFQLGFLPLGGYRIEWGRKRNSN
jgi:putative phosphoesterase